LDCLLSGREIVSLTNICPGIAGVSLLSQLFFDLQISTYIELDSYKHVKKTTMSILRIRKIHFSFSDANGDLNDGTYTFHMGSNINI